MEPMTERRKPNTAALRAILAARLEEAANAFLPGTSRREQAGVLDVPIATWIDTLNGKRMPSLERLSEYAAKLGVRLAWLVGEE